MAGTFASGGALHFDPTKQELHELLDILQKTAIEAFVPEAQTFLDKTICAKMQDHVKKILNREYLDDKHYRLAPRARVATKWAWRAR